MRVEFKFQESAPAAKRERVVATVTELGAKRVGPLFPDEPDPELASIYKAEGVPEDAADQLISRLDAQAEVEFAERTPERKLVR